MTQREIEALHRKLDAIAVIAILAAAAPYYKPKKRTLGDRLWDLL